MGEHVVDARRLPVAALLQQPHGVDDGDRTAKVAGERERVPEGERRLVGPVDTDDHGAAEHLIGHGGGPYRRPLPADGHDDGTPANQSPSSPTGMTRPEIDNGTMTKQRSRSPGAQQSTGTDRKTHSIEVGSIA